MVEIRRLQPSVPIALPVADRARSRRGPALVRHERWSKDFPPPTPQPEPCILWQGNLDQDGYGQINRRRRNHPEKWNSVKVHRHIMALALGRPLLRGEIVMHLCDNRLCFRISHLRIGSIADNNRDMFYKRRGVDPPRPLTYQQKRKIRYDFDTGVSVATLAREYGRSWKTIEKVISKQAPTSPKPMKKRPPKAFGGC